MSSGQLHFFLESRRALFGVDDDGWFAEKLIVLMRERFRREPYHVQLAILYSVGFARRAPAKTLEGLVQAIEALDVSPANWAINSSIIDALKVLGALEDQGEGSRQQIKRELASVLGDHDCAVNKDLALSLCVRMFDHPFDSIYWEEIHGLDEDLRRRLYRLALGASDIKNSMGLSWLTSQVISFNDVSDARLMQSLATLPDSSSFFPQETCAAFVMATRFLARHGTELPHVDEETPAARCLADIRRLIYAAESRRQADLEDARLAWQALHAMPAQLVIGCLGEVHAALTERHWSGAEQADEALDLVEVYLSDCLRVARRFVEAGVDAQYLREVASNQAGPSFAFGVIERYGDRSDIERLRGLSRAHPFARYALAAIKSLDTVSAQGS